MSRLRNQVALVTGASRGIGRAVAISLARAGADLVLTSTSERQEGLIAEVSALGARALHVRYDAASRADADRLVQAALGAFARVDILVNNAGIVVRAPLEQATDEDFDRVLAVNLAGPFYLARRLLPLMAARGTGRLVNVSSVSGTVGSARHSAYCASKCGLNGLTKALAEEVSGKGVLVAAVLPGSVDTDMLKGSGFSPDMQPADVAGVIRYLCAEAPLAMNGSLVEVFG